jgi:16S rRNA (uracil1498-N3)-methyltransferase
MTRLFVERLQAGEISVAGADWRYLTVVRRARVGDLVTLFDGKGNEAPAAIVAIDAARAVLRAEEPRPAVTGAPLPITLVMALLKGEKMDLVAQKCTELGVARIVPAAAARSVVRLDHERAVGRVARWRKIAREAARQCGRADAPEILSPLPFAEALTAASVPGGAGVSGGPGGTWHALLHEGERAVPLRSAFPAPGASAPPLVSAAIAVGPEGGFTPDEVDIARAGGWHIVGFGPRVLRAETAALAAVTVLAHALGDLG